ncbi:hypothetical protein P280DRAFT_526230 [Massarina eburnea CBS 473.64]|uniref:Uncharacterized protein n=1 Tax=Massarina eburnea CBS 473.64 TaxID=1395130 RepID=A0A6A6RYM5_9PLEO|nr:hypothetical protein P280DRAFT_526230 [Massarina eburnea CBS 473.64]
MKKMKKILYLELLLLLHTVLLFLFLLLPLLPTSAHRLATQLSHSTHTSPLESDISFGFKMSCRREGGRGNGWGQGRLPQYLWDSKNRLGWFAVNLLNDLQQAILTRKRRLVNLFKGLRPLISGLKNHTTVTALEAAEMDISHTRDQIQPVQTEFERIVGWIDVDRLVTFIDHSVDFRSGRTWKNKAQLKAHVIYRVNRYKACLEEFRIRHALILGEKEVMHRWISRRIRTLRRRMRDPNLSGQMEPDLLNVIMRPLFSEIEDACKQYESSLMAITSLYIALYHAETLVEIEAALDLIEVHINRTRDLFRNYRLKICRPFFDHVENHLLSHPNTRHLSTYYIRRLACRSLRRHVDHMQGAKGYFVSMEIDCYRILRKALRRVKVSRQRVREAVSRASRGEFLIHGPENDPESEESERV